MDVQTMRRMQNHKSRILVSIKREEKKERVFRERKTKRERCHPRYYLLGDQHG